jgi:hypothetical protein
MIENEGQKDIDNYNLFDKMEALGRFEKHQISQRLKGKNTRNLIEL